MNFKSVLQELNKRFPNHIKIYKIENNKKNRLHWEELPEEDFLITDDSRNIKENSLYFSTYFAKPYLKNAIDKKPFAIFINTDELKNILKESNYIGYCIVGKKNPDFYLGHLSSIYYGNPSHDMFIVAITGTNGKTTTSFMIYHLWKKKQIPSAVIGTLGVYFWDGKEERHIETGFTTPRAYELHKILNLLKQKNIKHIAIEASSEALSLRRLEGLNIQKAIFTSFGRDHLNFHKSLISYFFAKLHLFFLTLKTTKEEIPFVVVHDAKTFYLFNKFTKKTKARILFLLSSNLNYDFVKKQPMPLLFNQFNALCAFYGIAKDNQFLYQLSETPLEDFKGVSGRVDKINFNNNIDIIIDYAHTPDAMECLLKELKKNYDFLTIVFGCGGNRDKEKRPLMGKIAAKYCNLIFITDDNPRNEDPQKIREEIKQGIPLDKHEVLKEISDRKLAIYNAIESTYKINHKDKKYCIIIAGKGHENYQIIGNKKIPFSDKEIVNDFLKFNNLIKI